MPGEDIAPWKLYLIMATMIIFGTCNTLVLKAQDDFVVQPGWKTDDKGKPVDRLYTHPYFQCANMFLGELMCLFVYFFKTRVLAKKQKEYDETNDPNAIPPSSPGTQLANQAKLKTKINPLLFAIPAAFDCIGSSLLFVGLTQTSASIYQMMRGAIIVITAIMSVVFLKRKQHFHHIASIAVIVTGVALVGYCGIKASSDGDAGKSKTTLFGVMVCISSQLFAGGQFVVEEKLLSGYYLDPLYVVGCEGFFGLCYYCCLLPIFQRVDCTTVGLCGDAGVIDDSSLAFQQLGQFPILLWMSFGIVVSIAAFNATGVSITKYASAAQRSTIDTSRTLLIWVVSIAIGNEDWNTGQFFAFILLAAGTLVYNEIVVVPIDIFRRNTSKAIAAREAEENPDGAVFQAGNTKGYMATSPGAAYDQGRNARAIDNAQGERDRLIQMHQTNGLKDDGGDFHLANGSAPGSSDGQR